MKKILSVMMSMVIVFTAISSQWSVSATNTDPLKVYRERLNELNQKYKTNFIIPENTSEGGGYSEIIETYSKMTLEEFDNYILSVVNGSIYNSNDPTVETNNFDYNVQRNTQNANASVNPHITQLYYYKSNSVANYLSANSTRKYENWKYKYVSLDKTHYAIKEYPGFVPKYTNYSFKYDNQGLSIRYTCDKFYSKTLSDGTIWTIPVVFSAKGDSVYAH